MKEIEMGSTKYIGGEIVRELVDQNNRLYASPARKFMYLDLLTSTLPDSDVILCRDCLAHLPTKFTSLVLQNIKRSQAGYLILSHYPLCTENKDVAMGKFRRMNLELAPFHFPPPLETWEDFDGQYEDKTLAVWKIARLPSHL